jgi:hypothetical protein
MCILNIKQHVYNFSQFLKSDPRMEARLEPEDTYGPKLMSNGGS